MLHSCSRARGSVPISFVFLSCQLKSDDGDDDDGDEWLAADSKYIMI